VLDIPVPEIVLQSPGVMAVIGKLEAAGVPKHVGMHGKWHLGGLAKPCTADVMDAWRATLGSADMQVASIKLDLMPSQVAHLGVLASRGGRRPRSS
jgi:hypothetical protein